MPVRFLTKAFGKNGIVLWKKANAIDNSPVESYWEQKSMSTECTFHHDSIDIQKMKTMLIAMVEKLCSKLRQDQKLTCCVAVKIRYTNFDTESKQKHIPYSSADHQISKVVMELI